MTKLKPVKRGRPALLQSPAEAAAERDRLLAEFHAWFDTIPGAEVAIAFEPPSSRVLLYCKWYAVPERPEWGKVFCAHTLGDRDGLAYLKRTVVSNERFPPGDWDHWKHLGLSKNADRAAIVERFHERMAAEKNVREQRWIEIAYGRCLNDRWLEDRPNVRGVSDVRRKGKP